MKDSTKGYLLIAAFIIALFGYATNHSDTGGSSTCEKEYAQAAADTAYPPNETHDQFMQHCVSDFDNYK